MVVLLETWNADLPHLSAQRRRYQEVLKEFCIAVALAPKMPWMVVEVRQKHARQVFHLKFEEIFDVRDKA